MQKEYNLLTEKLLKEGYDAEHYPDYVRVDSSRLPGNDPLNNLAGGFCYKRTYIADMVFRTGCGKHVLGKTLSRKRGNIYYDLKQIVVPYKDKQLSLI